MKNEIIDDLVEILNDDGLMNKKKTKKDNLKLQ